MVVHVLGIGSCTLAPLALLAFGLVSGDTWLTCVALTAMAAYWGGVVVSTLAIEQGMQRVLQTNGVESSWMNATTAIRLAPAMLLAHLVCLRMLAGVCWRNRVSWRGVEYEIQGKNEVRLLAYRPYVTVVDQTYMESVA